MRKIIVTEFVTLDGVIQAPGGPEEDTSGGFEYGGWTVPYSDELIGTVITEQISQPFDLLLGRKTYDIWDAYWPNQDATASPIAEKFNQVTKYVVSRSTGLQLGWTNSSLIATDVVAQIKALKAEGGPDLQVYGSGNLVQTLLKHDLVDAMWLKIYPIMLGTGKRLFAEGTIPAAFALEESQVSPKGVVVASYKRAGEVETGSFT